MKKIFPLLCAFALIVSAYAVPEFKSEKTLQRGTEATRVDMTQKAPESKVRPVSKFAKTKKGEQTVAPAKQTEQTTVSQSSSTHRQSMRFDASVAQDIKAPQRANTYADKKSTAIDFHAKHGTLQTEPLKAHEALNTSAQKARRATEAVTTIDIKGVTVDEEDYRYYFYSTDENYEIQFSFKNEVEDGVIYDQYDLKDMWQYGIYSWMRDLTIDLDSHVFSYISFVKTNVNGVNHYEAEFTSEGRQYAFSFDEQPEEEFVPTGDTIYVNFTSSAKYSFSYSYVEWVVANNDYYVSLEFSTPSSTTMVGTYTEESLNNWYTYIRPAGTAGVQVVKANFTVTETTDRIDLKGDFLCQDGNVYNITSFFEVPKATSSKELTATNLTISDLYASSYGFIILDAFNETDSIELTYYGYSLSYLPGTYAVESDIFGDIWDEDGGHSLIYGDITITKDGGNWAVTGKVIADNYVEYNLNLTYIMPEPVKKSLTVDDLNIEIGPYTWQVLGYSADKNFYVSLAAYGALQSGNYKSYDLMSDYCYVVDMQNEAWYDMIDADITLTVVEGEKKTATITGTFTGKNAYDWNDVVEYTLTITAKEVELTEAHYPFDTQSGVLFDSFNTYIVDDSYFPWYGTLVAYAQNDDNTIVNITFVPEDGQSTITPGVYPINASEQAMTVIAGSSDEDGYIYDSYAGYVSKTTGNLSALWLLVDGTVTVAEDGLMTVDAKNSYNQTIRLTIGAPTEPEEPGVVEVDVAEYSFVYDPDYKDVYYAIINEDQSITMRFDFPLPDGQTDVQLGKTYTLSEMDADYSWMSDSKRGKDLNYVSATFTKTITEEGYDHVEAEVLAANGFTYVINYTNTPVLPTGDTIVVNFEERVLPFYYDNGSVEWQAQNDNYFVDITYYSNTLYSPVGSYTLDDCDRGYTFLADMVEGISYSVADAMIEVTGDEDGYDLHAYLLARNGVVYDVTMFYNLPKAENFAQINATNLEIDDTYLDWLGVVRLFAYDDNHAILMNVNATGLGEALAGDYVVGVDFNGTILNIYEEEFEIEVGSINIAYNDGNYSVTGKVIASNNTEYTLNLTYTPHLQYDAETDFAKDFDSYQLETQEIQGVYAVEAYYLSDEYQIEILFFSQTEQLKPGVYAINDSYEVGSVMASQGYVEGEGIYMSYFATLIDYQGKIYLNDMWYMVGGTVTVNDDATITVDAVNSWGHTIKSTLGTPVVDSVENINSTNAGATKRVIDGVLYIESNGKTYNAQGVRLK